SRKRVDRAVRICSSLAIFWATSVSHRRAGGGAFSRSSARSSGVTTPSRERASHSSGKCVSAIRSLRYVAERGWGRFGRLEEAVQHAINLPQPPPTPPNLPTPPPTLPPKSPPTSNPRPPPRAARPDPAPPPTPP